MDLLTDIGAWITAHESLLSGVAALFAVVGVLISVGAFLFRRQSKIDFSISGSTVRQNDTRSVERSSAGESSLSYSALTAPAEVPVQFANSSGYHIAYMDIGEGAPSLVLSPGIISHLNVLMNFPPTCRMIESFSSIRRLLVFDKRGQGLSDPFPEAPTLENRCEDIEAVMSAADVDEAILVGISESGPMTIAYAAEHPENIKGLVLLGTGAKFLQSPDFPMGIPEEALDVVVKLWGKGKLRSLLWPEIPESVISDEAYQAIEKLIASRQSIKQLIDYMKSVDVRDYLPRLRVPVLILHITGDLAIPIRLGRALAEEIPQARFVEINGSGHADISRTPEAVAAIKQFCDEIGRR